MFPKVVGFPKSSHFSRFFLIFGNTPYMSQAIWGLTALRRQPSFFSQTSRASRRPKKNGSNVSWCEPRRRLDWTSCFLTVSDMVSEEMGTKQGWPKVGPKFWPSKFLQMVCVCVFSSVCLFGWFCVVCLAFWLGCKMWFEVEKDKDLLMFLFWNLASVSVMSLSWNLPFC